VPLFIFVLINEEARFWGRIFQDLPDILLPFVGTSRDILTISPFTIVAGSTGTASFVTIVIDAAAVCAMIVRMNSRLGLIDLPVCCVSCYLFLTGMSSVDRNRNQFATANY
jgi:hypothetical protein